MKNLIEMNLSRKIKDNRIIRGSYFLLRHICSFYGPGRKKFGYMADNVIITPPISISNPKNVFVYDDVSLGAGATISALNAKFVINPHVVIAHGLNVQTGNHAMVLGKFACQITEKDKPSGYDHDVIVENDVWIGAHVTLLQGVTIGRGCTIAAGAVVVKDMPPYCVCGGVPAKPIKMKWTVDEILEHEAKLYPENERYSREQLEEIFAKYSK